MNILVSKCLLGENCKYSGGNNYNESVVEFCKNHNIIPICPECMGGLPTPREPSEIRFVDGVEKVFTKSGCDVSEMFRKGAKASLEAAKENEIELCILKESSPSCGANTIYDGTFSHVKIPGMGLTAKLLKENGFKILSEKDIENNTD